ncbi:MAG: class I SAM-dependent methyltransferase [Actinomycetota bacterium]|nr:class I SAM-dependent methyltransferase [Actinomycetota bacterium]
MAEYDSRRYVLINRWDPSHLKNIDRLLPLSNQRVLEVGCGQGHLTKRLADRGVDITGIDANPNAREVSECDRVFYMRGEALEFDDATFDAVLSVHALEHIPDIEGAISEMARVLKPGGKALHIYPAEPIMGLYAIPTSIILHGTPFKARQVHCHKLWPSKLRGLMEPTGLAELHSEFQLFKSPQFVSVFEMRA